jgi:hypothetical protein
MHPGVGNDFIPANRGHGGKLFSCLRAGLHYLPKPRIRRFERGAFRLLFRRKRAKNTMFVRFSEIFVQMAAFQAPSRVSVA